MGVKFGRCLGCRGMQVSVRIAQFDFWSKVRRSSLKSIIRLNFTRKRCESLAEAHVETERFAHSTSCPAY